VYCTIYYRIEFIKLLF